jgi:WD40 repeat protein
VSGSQDETFRVWDVESGKTILGPIDFLKEWEKDFQVEEFVLRSWVVCYSPDAKMIATGGASIFLHIRDANTGKELKTLLSSTNSSLAWTSDGKTLIAADYMSFTKFDTATWTVLANPPRVRADPSRWSLSPKGRMLASASTLDVFSRTAQLWNLETGKLIGAPLHHQDHVSSATFSADGKFLVTCCRDHHIYTWDVSAIVKEASLPSDIVSIHRYTSFWSTLTTHPG